MFGVRIVIHFIRFVCERERVNRRKKMKDFSHRLANCPNCESFNLEIHKNFDYVFCKHCGVGGPQFDGHPEDAIAGWNSLPRREHKEEFFFNEDAGWVSEKDINDGLFSAKDVTKSGVFIKLKEWLLKPRGKCVGK